MSRKRREPRVAFVTNVLAHYRVPCFEALAARLPGRIDFYLLAETMAHRSYVMAGKFGTIPIEVLPGKAFGHAPYDDTHINDPHPALRDHDLIVLGGWAEPTYLLLWALALLSRKRVAFWLESTADDLEREGWKEALKRTMVKRAAGIVVSGTSAYKYAAQLGAPPERIFRAPNAIDVTYFKKQARMLLTHREMLRAELGMKGTVILFVGRMVDAFKNVSVLLEAQVHLNAKNLDTQLVLIGEGPDRAQFEMTTRETNMQNAQFVNFIDHDALCRYYAAADIFVLPSRSEPWGFVLNEAMEFGLPLVVSNVVGAAPDLVAPNENGFVVPPGDARALADALEMMVRNQAMRTRMGARSRDIIARFTPEAWADGFAHALVEMTR